MSIQPNNDSYSRRTLVALMEDRPGALSFVVNLFRRRNYNIESLSVGHSEVPGLSRMTVVVTGSDAVVEQGNALTGANLLNKAQTACRQARSLRSAVFDCGFSAGKSE